MNWFKQNLTLVIGIVVSLVVLGVAGWYARGQFQKQKDAEERLSARKEAYLRLLKNDPFPSDSNIEAVKKDEQRIAATENELRSFFFRPELPDKVNQAMFKKYLDNALYEMEVKANRAGVQLPNDFHFTFSQERTRFNLDTDAIRPMFAQLKDLELISDILFDAKIHRLMRMRRAGVAMGDDPDRREEDLVKRNIETNEVTGMIVSPYDVEFRSFSTELGKVLTGFATSKQTFLIKSVTVEAVDPEFDIERDDGLPNTLGHPIRGGGSVPAQNPAMTQRYGMGGMGGYGMGRGGYGAAGMGMGNPYGGGYNRGAMPVQPMIIQRPTGLDTILNQQLLKIRLIIQGVKPQDQESDPETDPSSPTVSPQQTAS